MLVDQITLDEQKTIIEAIERAIDEAYVEISGKRDKELQDFRCARNQKGKNLPTFDGRAITGTPISDGDADNSDNRAESDTQ